VRSISQYTHVDATALEHRAVSQTNVNEARTHPRLADEYEIQFDATNGNMNIQRNRTIFSLKQRIQGNGRRLET
jgi:hypothetical protein